MTPTITLPKLRSPFPPAVNRHAEAANQETLEWIQRFDLVKDERAYRRLRASRFGWLAAHAYPNAGREELSLVSDWNTWLFIRDDLCDESGLGSEPERLGCMHMCLLDILAGRKPARSDAALAHALYDLSQRLRRKGDTSWFVRFAHSVGEYFESNVWEARNRKYGLTPDPATYIKMRPYTGGLYSDVELIEITEKIRLPLAVRKQSLVERLTLTANNVVCWSNDILSLPKERKHGDVHNLAIVLSESQGIGLQEAVDQAAKRCAREQDLFVSLEKQLPSFGTRADRDLQRYLSVLRSWMRGNLDWSYASGRYQSAEESPRDSSARQLLCGAGP